MHGMAANSSDVPSMLLGELLSRWSGHPTPDLDFLPGSFGIPNLPSGVPRRSLVVTGLGSTPSRRSRALRAAPTPLRRIVRRIRVGGASRDPPPGSSSLSWMPRMRHQPHWSSRRAFAVRRPGRLPRHWTGGPRRTGGHDPVGRCPVRGTGIGPIDLGRRCSFDVLPPILKLAGAAASWELSGEPMPLVVSRQEGLMPRQPIGVRRRSRHCIAEPPRTQRAATRRRGQASSMSGPNGWPDRASGTDQAIRRTERPSPSAAGE